MQFPQYSGAGQLAVLHQPAANIHASQFKNMGCYVEYGWDSKESCAAIHGVVVDTTPYLDNQADYDTILRMYKTVKQNIRIKKMSFRATVESMSKIMDDMGITELNLERQFLFGVYRKHIHLSKQQTVTVAPAGGNAEIKCENNNKNTKNTCGCALKSPMVGVVYLAPEPGAEPFVTIGKPVQVGDTVALVEAMKTFNPIKADKTGIVKDILVTDGAAVEFDQPLIVIE